MPFSPWNLPASESGGNASHKPRGRSSPGAQGRRERGRAWGGPAASCSRVVGSAAQTQPIGHAHATQRAHAGAGLAGGNRTAWGRGGIEGRSRRTAGRWARRRWDCLSAAGPAVGAAGRCHQSGRWRSLPFPAPGRASVEGPCRPSGGGRGRAGWSLGNRRTSPLLPPSRTASRPSNTQVSSAADLLPQLWV